MLPFPGQQLLICSPSLSCLLFVALIPIPAVIFQLPPAFQKFFQQPLSYRIFLVWSEIRKKCQLLSIIKRSRHANISVTVKTEIYMSEIGKKLQIFRMGGRVSQNFPTRGGGGVARKTLSLPWKRWDWDWVFWNSLGFVGFFVRFICFVFWESQENYSSNHSVRTEIFWVFWETEQQQKIPKNQSLPREVQIGTVFWIFWGKLSSVDWFFGEI